METRKYALAAALGLMALAAPRTVQADEVYQFNVNVNTAGSINAFSFSLTAPGFVASGDSPAFTPFNVTDGTQTWTIASDLATNSFGSGCFMFGTAGSVFGSGGPCSITENPPSNGGFFLFSSAPLPTGPGTYSLTSGLGIFEGQPSRDVLLSATLIVSSAPVPEPSSLLLLGTGLLGLGAVIPRRTRSLQ